MRLLLLIGVACLSFLLLSRENSISSPTVPDLAYVVNWKPQPDRTMQVDFEGASFRYTILDDKPAPLCQMVMPTRDGELRWITRSGHQAHQYLTKKEPFLYREAGDTEWRWLSLKSYRDCLRYDSDEKKCTD